MTAEDITAAEAANNEANGTGDGADGAVTAVGTAEDQTVRAEGKAAEYLDLLQRERASFINFRRRSEQERSEAQQYATAQLLRKLLPVVDDFDRALSTAPTDNAWIEGVRLINRKLHTLLEQEGVTQIEAVGQPFDPTLHEAIAYEDGGEGDDVVAEEFAPGYRHKDRVLRHAVVKVGKRQPEGSSAG
ncbi:MAG TPA: nucleotide exchange factor GrpE [Chloroflexia bacterium]|nr:nucleotide exchange factor GrpE [Chloroflexia bacterium]